MYKIGEFSKMSKVTIKALRYYEEAGCKFIALDVRNKEDSKKLMEYLISIREKIFFTQNYGKRKMKL